MLSLLELFNVIRCGRLDFLDEYLNKDQKRLGFDLSSVAIEMK